MEQWINYIYIPCFFMLIVINSKIHKLIFKFTKIKICYDITSISEKPPYFK